MHPAAILPTPMSSATPCSTLSCCSGDGASATHAQTPSAHGRLGLPVAARVVGERAYSPSLMRDLLHPAGCCIGASTTRSSPSVVSLVA
ncbi:unnamed protein product [Peniophora sp. CBMAI 1063]|nr:unnamed protein product [Peniophora sp. CBMAI 1063]